MKNSYFSIKLIVNLLQNMSMFLCLEIVHNEYQNIKLYSELY